MVERMDKHIKEGKYGHRWGRLMLPTTFKEQISQLRKTKFLYWNKGTEKDKRLYPEYLRDRYEVFFMQDLSFTDAFPEERAMRGGLSITA